MRDNKAPPFRQGAWAGRIYGKVLQDMLAYHQARGHGSSLLCVGSEVQKHEVLTQPSLPCYPRCNPPTMPKIIG
jgi:hypothetical protein